jgi:hypothetical protein
MSRKGSETLRLRSGQAMGHPAVLFPSESSAAGIPANQIHDVVDLVIEQI